MIDAVGEVADGQVILELGPGTGVFTRELLRRFPHARVVVIEVNDVFASRLAATMPAVTVVTGCASRLDEHLATLGLTSADVAAVVSGLPLLSLPGDLPGRVLTSVGVALRPGRRYVQFTYSQRIWWNIPPACVLPFTRND
jgi:phosphatidylethanolamine/phosphatidyl-N-methylethanolamine N-methyltransferase